MHPRKKVSLLRVNGFCFPESIRQVCRMEVAPKGSSSSTRGLTCFLLEIFRMEENK